jgi:citrate lyase beta subunit
MRWSGASPVAAGGPGGAGARLTLRECLTYNDRATPTSLDSVRSLLFAPGSDERKLRRAAESGADAMTADLEDAVAPAEKDAARTLTCRVLAEVPDSTLKTVRINGADTEFFHDDVAAVGDLPLAGMVLPKATPGAVEALGVSGPPVIAIVETAMGLRLAFETARMPRVAALMLGAVDLAAELRLEPRADGLEILHARSRLVVDSAAAGIRGPLDVVHLNVRDEESLEAEARLARSLGMQGKACIHPAQVPVVNRVFGPDPAQLDWASAVVEAFEQGLAEGRGAVALNGQMIDLPVVERARTLLAMAEGTR